MQRGVLAVIFKNVEIVVGVFLAALKKSKFLQGLFWVATGLLAALFVTRFFFEILKVPTPSMETAIGAGQNITLNRLVPGPRFGANSVGSYFRLRLAKLDCGDIVVFNCPESDTVIKNRVNESYHFLQRNRAQLNTPESPAALQTLKVTQRPQMIKRITALPGDTLQIIAGEVYINRQPVPQPSTVVHLYKLKEAGIAHQIKNSGKIIRNNESLSIEMSDAQFELNSQYSQLLQKVLIPLNYPDQNVFPFIVQLGWNVDYMGPVYMPAKGDVIEITAENLPFYRRLIESYEDNSIEITGDTLLINGKPASSYRFKMNYYWVMGDNRPHSFDSRYWGPVPENHIIGKVNRRQATQIIAPS